MKSRRPLCRDQLEPGDRLVFHTDGITEARRAGNEEWGLARFTDCLIGRHTTGTTRRSCSANGSVPSRRRPGGPQPRPDLRRPLLAQAERQRGEPPVSTDPSVTVRKRGFATTPAAHGKPVAGAGDASGVAGRL
ncbi:SpoIIE family protein phosphatase [Streptomyces avidinii]|uniref:SpoIIE family protein phosphatase n=1 Tax=Streptomyces avidinii TaxID=1895 RepID=UPI00199A619E|nr:hypothetical protein GCM10010343_13200 [Streptomyces avidinii]